MISVSAHDRISGTPPMVRTWDAFLRYVKERPGVAYLRKDTIARWALESLTDPAGERDGLSSYEGRPPALNALSHGSSEQACAVWHGPVRREEDDCAVLIRKPEG
jgi:hypothetical protein